MTPAISPGSSKTSPTASWRVGRRVLAVVMIFASLLLAGAGVAHAQDPSKSRPFVTDAELAQGKAAAAAQAAAEAEAARVEEPSLSQSTGAAVVFWLFAFITVAGSIFVITRRNLISAVMGMVGTFFGIAAVYAMLYAQFLTVIQVLVYAGAIMVLFVFVIMILNKPETEPWSSTNLPGKIAIGLLLLYLLVRLGAVLWSIEPPPETLKAPEPIMITGAEGPYATGFGSTRALGDTLFREYLFPFEAVSLVLLIAVVGAIAVARPHQAMPGMLPQAGDDQAGNEAANS
jgi:NADH-quinone oxidoreductase subunit J